jgi:hypothetical protein
MNGYRKRQIVVLLGFALSLAGGLFAQAVSDKQVDGQLVVNGKTMTAAVRQIDGHFYVDVETLAQITNGLVTLEPDRIVLTTPDSKSGSAPQSVQGQEAQGLSKTFVIAAIAALADMKEWKGALGTMVTFGLATTGAFAQDYHGRVQTSSTQANAAASTDADRNAVQLLNTEFASLAKWAGEIVAERQVLNGARTVDPNALQNDRALAKISDCDRFLSAMLVSGSFADNSTCH